MLCIWQFRADYGSFNRRGPSRWCVQEMGKAMWPECSQKPLELHKQAAASNAVQQIRSWTIISKLQQALEAQPAAKCSQAGR